MGLSFYYNGRIANPDSLPDLIEEVVEICKVYHWKYFVFDRQFPEISIEDPDYTSPIYGISFTPPKCETVDVCFLSNGEMVSPALLQQWDDSKTFEENEHLLLISVKTQYAGVDIHRNIIQLFHYINEKYLDDFILVDDSDYWDTNDEALLKENFKRHTDLINEYALALESQDREEGEDIETYLLRMAQQLHDRRKREE